MIPFLKKKQEGSISQSPDEVMTRSPDEDPGFDLMDAIVEDMIEAIHKKDKAHLKMALESLVDHIKHADEAQDQSLES